MSVDSTNPLHRSKLRLSGLKQVNKDLTEIYSTYTYQPNFVLVHQSQSGNNANLFGDILPFYSSYQELASVIVTTWDGLYNLILQSSTFVVCVLSFFNQVVNNAVYQSYLIVTTGYERVAALPDRYSKIKEAFFNLIQTLSTAETRELWWLEAKLDTRLTLAKAQKILDKAWVITQKLYLALVVFACLGVLHLGTVFNPTPSSFLSSFVQNNSFTKPSQAVLGVSSMNPQVSAATGLQSTTPIQKIVEHTVVEGQTIQEIAEVYSVSVDTVAFNNKIQDNKINPDQKLYIPWVNGYIYNAPKEITPKEISEIYGLDESVIAGENQAILNTENNKFQKDSLILLPTQDFKAIEEANKRQEEKERNLKALEKMEKERTSNLAKQAVSAKTYQGATASNARANGFIWPTTGSISRCLQPGHVACDIANFSAPPIFAVQDGVVTTVSYYNIAGYGLAVIIDHGNGIRTLYAHMSEIYVTNGQRVSQGQAIGRMGTTGWSTGIHLHFEVIVNGQKQNPLNYLP